MDFKVDSKGFDDFIDKMSVNSENLENNVRQEFFDIYVKRK